MQMTAGEASQDAGVGTVLVVGAGLAGIRAAGDLAAAGHDVLLTDDSPIAEALLAVLGATPPAGQRCGLCSLVIPEEEHEVASFYCMHRVATTRPNITVARTKRIAHAGGSFRVELADGSVRAAHAAIVAGTQLDDPGARERLQRLLDDVPGAAATRPEFERARTGKRGVFACGAAVGAVEVPAALTSASAAASEASRYLAALGMRRHSTPLIPRSAGVDLRSITVVQQALVLGGTVAGLRAALSLAERGVEVQVVDPGNALCAWPPLEPAGEAAAGFVATLCEAALASPLISVRLDTEVVQHAGSVGRFLTVVRKRGEPDDTLLPHGATILATHLGFAAHVGVTADAQAAPGRYDSAALAGQFGVEATQDGSLQEASRFKPVDCLKQGLYLARPSRDLAAAVQNGEAAAQRAYRYLAWPELSVQRVVASIRSEACTQCKDCLSLCPYEARTEGPDGRVVLDEDACAGCGLCAVYCTGNASEVPGPVDPETMALIEATLADARRILP